MAQKSETKDREYEVFATCLRMCRAKADLSQNDLAKLIGVHQQSVANWETGDYMPSLKATVKLADALGVSIDQLVGREPIAVG